MGSRVFIKLVTCKQEVPPVHPQGNPIVFSLQLLFCKAAQNFQYHTCCVDIDVAGHTSGPSKVAPCPKRPFYRLLFVS